MGQHHTWNVSTHTEVGHREEQEDALAVSGGVLVIADGMGGERGGALAARTAVDAVIEELGEEASRDELEDAIRWGATRVRELRGGCTTLLVACVNEHAHATIGWVGDSGAFWISAEGDVEQLTTPHIDSSGGLTRWIPDEPLPDLLDVELDPGDLIVLCTDGITDVLAEDEIAVIATSEDDAALWLVEAALEAGSSDNCTAIVLHINHA